MSFAGYPSRAAGNSEAAGPVLRRGEDVVQLHCEACCRAAGELGHSVALLEPKHELLARVVDPIELIEPEQERRRLLTRDEEEPRLDVVRAPELMSLPPLELPALPVRGPVLEGGRVVDRRLVDSDHDRCIRPLFRSDARLDGERGHRRDHGYPISISETPKALKGTPLGVVGRSLNHAAAG